MARYKRPTKKQVDALTLIENGLSPTEAMRRAGYAESTIRIPKQALLKSAGAQSIKKIMQGELESQGINGIYLADRLAEFAKSNKLAEFIAAYDRISKINELDSNKEDQTLKRSITFNEWVTDK